MADDLLLDGSDALLLEGSDTLLLEESVSAPLAISFQPNRHATDFREYPRGILPGDFTPRWTVGSKARVEGALYDLPGRNTLQLTGGSDVARHLVTWNAIDNDTGRGNQEMLVLLRPVTRGLANAAVAFPTLRASGTAGAENGYRLLLGVDSTMTIGKIVGGVATDLNSIGKAFVLGGWYWIRYGATGTTIRSRVWADGDAEPALWDMSATDASFSDGYLGFYLVTALARYDIKYLGVGTNDVSAPEMSSLPRTLEEWSSDPSADLETTIEFERADSAGVISRVYYTNGGARHTGVGDYPPNVDFENVIVSAGGWSQQLSADALFASGVFASMQGMELRNVPKTPKGPGPLDDWDNYSFAGRKMTIRMGERRQMHRRFEVIFSPSVVGEPEGKEDTVHVSIGPRMRDGSSKGAPRGRLADQPLEVRRYVGIPTGVFMMTSTGAANAPTHGSYDIRSFVAAGRFKTTGLNNGAGTGAGQLASRSISPTNRQFRVNMMWLGHATPGTLEIRCSIGGVATLLGVTSERYDDGEDHWWGIGILDGTRFYMLVDGELVLSGAMTGSVDLPSTAFQWGASSKDGLIYDTRFGEWIDEDQMRATMAGRLLAPIPLQWKGYWPGDDAVGSTATDYSANANHAALTGALNTDFRWDPTDAGMPGQTGRPMPLSLGVLFNAKAEQHDALRGRFRINDGALPVGTVATIKARGLAISSGPDYTQPAPGVVDMVTAQSEPVTYDLSSSGTPESETIHVPLLIGNALAARASATPAEVDFDSFAALRKLLPLRGGAAYSQPPTTEALLDQLGPLGAHHFIERYGRIGAGFLAPPLNPGPYGQEGLLEFLGVPNRGVTISSHASYSLKQGVGWGLTAWVKFNRVVTDLSTPSSFAYFPLGSTVIDRSGASATGYYLGFDGRNGDLIFGSPGITSLGTGLHYLAMPYKFHAHRWYLVGGAWFDNPGIDERMTFVWPLGAGFEDVKSEGTTGVMTDPVGEPLRVGHGPLGSFHGSIAYAIGSSNARVFSFRQAMATTRPSPYNDGSIVDRFFVSMNEGEGDTIQETVQNRSGRLEGARWCPRLTLDFTLHTEPRFGGSRRLKPAWQIAEKFRKNFSPVTGADVSSSVTGADRVAIETAYLEAPIQETSLRDVYLDAREITLDSILADQEHASAVGHEIRARFSPDRRVGDARGWRREALRLHLTDELFVKHYRYGLDAGVPCRVASLAPSFAVDPKAHTQQVFFDISSWR